MDPPAILALPLELREEIFALALQDIILEGPECPYDEHIPSGIYTMQERLMPLLDLRSVSRQFCHEVDQVFRRDIAPRAIFYYFSSDQEITHLCNLWGKGLRPPALMRGARFYLRSPNKETICANDDADMIWDTLVESQAGCERISYEEDPQVMAGWALNPASAPENVTVSSPPQGKWGYRCSSGEVRTFCKWATILYEPLAKSLRLKSFAWVHDGLEGDTLDGLVVCSILEGKLEDLDFDAFDELAGRKYRQQAMDFVPARFWSLYGWADVERKRALRAKLIEVGADWVVKSQKECDAVDEEAETYLRYGDVFVLEMRMSC
ncbi:hypothetical protein PRZ48_011845 [Zasmidium cellare]|uniref:F-box domain-containing protein n=1 Tax=Zasmidium cellare TaxID=395010 RepID=A0ABR0E7K6_ZASCE|nr:hypothetical protein PRZ48_011845 [Zasmidium cellare]